MNRVNRTTKCPICGKDSWCLIGRSVIICMRVQSDRVKEFKGGEVGWVHPLDPNAKPIPFKREATKRPVINVGRLLKDWKQITARHDLWRASEKLGVSIESLIALEFYRPARYDAWATPMRDGLDNYVGIRIRHDNGQKWAQPGSHAGIFIPRWTPKRTVLITEGPTDTAAALTLGYFAIGRPSCTGGVPYITDAVKRLQVERVVIVADNDAPGIRGAQMLQQFLMMPSCILVPPAKDLRQFLAIGGNKKIIDGMIDSVTWSVPEQHVQPTASSSC